MATTIDTRATEDQGTQNVITLERTRRTNHWLTGAVIVLALALVAMGAWVAYDASSEPVTAATNEVQSLYDDYLAAWTTGDTDAFSDATTEGFVQYSFGNELDRSVVAMNVASGIDVELVGDLVMIADGTNYYVAAVEKITFGASDFEGVSAYRLVPTPEGLKISEHTWVGNL